jgi:6-phosphofructokinase 1
MCLIPEVEYDLKDYEESFKQDLKEGRDYFLAIVSEGVKQDSAEISKWFEETIGIESRVSILGHVQRGGNPSIYDRLMAYKFVNYAIDALLENRNESVVCYTKSGFEYKSIDEVTKPYKLDKDLIRML